MLVADYAKSDNMLLEAFNILFLGALAVDDIKHLSVRRLWLIFYYYGSAEGHEYPVLYRLSDNYLQ